MLPFAPFIFAFGPLYCLRVHTSQSSLLAHPEVSHFEWTDTNSVGLNTHRCWKPPLTRRTESSLWIFVYSLIYLRPGVGSSSRISIFIFVRLQSSIQVKVLKPLEMSTSPFNSLPSGRHRLILGHSVADDAKTSRSLSTLTFFIAAFSVDFWLSVILSIIFMAIQVFLINTIFFRCNFLLWDMVGFNICFSLKWHFNFTFIIFRMVNGIDII